MTMADETTGAPPTCARIADALGETAPAPRGHIRAIVAALGAETALALLAETQRIEADGGQSIRTCSRRRTPGGVFFHLAYQRLDPEQRRRIYRRRPPRSGDSTAQPAPPRDPPLTWAERGSVIAAAQAGKATTVKVTIRGRPANVVEQQRFTLVLLQHTPRLDTLPKGLPRPEQPVATSYVLSISAKQWHGVKEALTDPADVLICEGTQCWDSQHQVLAVFVTTTTTKLLQQAKRSSQQAQAE
jgi:hypothetical protein